MGGGVAKDILTTDLEMMEQQEYTRNSNRKANNNHIKAGHKNRQHTSINGNINNTDDKSTATTTN